LTDRSFHGNHEEGAGAAIREKVKNDSDIQPTLCRPEIAEIDQLSPGGAFPVGPISLKIPVEDVVSDH
jgi:hypothetical protein